MRYIYNHEKGATLTNRQGQSFAIKNGVTFSLEGNMTASVVVDDQGNQFKISKDSALKLIERSDEVTEKESFIDRIKRIVPVAEEYLKEVYNKDGTPDYFKGIVVDVGPKYTRLSLKTGGSQSAWCFIDNQTEQLWKPASYKAPTKNFSRGTLDKLLERKFVLQHQYGF